MCARERERDAWYKNEKIYLFFINDERIYIYIFFKWDKEKKNVYEFLQFLERLVG